MSMIAPARSAAGPDGVRWSWSLAKLFVLVIVVGGAFAVPKLAAAATRTWDGGGTTNNWSEPANWSSNLVPTAADNAVFNGTSSKNAVIDVGVTSLGISLSSGYVGTVTQAAANPITITGSGDLVVASGTFNAGSGAISVADQVSISGGTFNASTGLLIVDGGDFVVSTGTFNPGSGTVRFNRLAIGININVTQNFHNVEITEGNNLAVTITSGDTIIVNGTLTLADGVVNTGVIKARGNVVQGEFFDGGTSPLDFDNSAVAQTYTINGGSSPSLRLDDPADANDEIRFVASGTLSTLSTLASFGAAAIPITNPNNVPVNVRTWSQAAGTYDASAQTNWNFQTFIRSGGTFIAPATVTAFGISTTWDVPIVQEFRNFTVNRNAAASLALASGDTLAITGLTTLNEGLMSGGTLQAAGNVKINPTYDGGSTVLTFIGNANQVFDTTGAAGLYNGDILVNKPGGGEVDLISPIVLDVASQDLILQVGAMSLNGNNVTVNGTNGRLILQAGTNFKLQGNEVFTLNPTFPTINAGSTVTYTGDGDGQPDGFAITTFKNIYRNLVIDSIDSNDTFVLGSVLDVNESLTITSGTLDATINNFGIAVAGNWSNNGAFTANQGTVTLDGANQTISGSTTFFNLTKVATSAATLTVDANFVQTVNGTLNWSGPSASARMLVRSSVPGLRARITPLGPRTAQFLDVKDMDNDATLALPCVNGCVNSGNNENWTFASISVSPISGTTDENAGKATYTIVLDSQPTTNVIFTLTSTDTTEGTVSPSSVTFSRTNWNVPRTITVSGIDDIINDGDIAYAINHVISGGDPAFTQLGPLTVAVTNLDNEQIGPGILVSALSQDTTEAAGTGTFTVVLASRPQANVVIGITSSDTTEGRVNLSSLTFTNTNWATPRTVTVTGQNDNLDDGDIAYNIVTAAATSTDPLYSGLNAADVPAINVDNDTAGYTLTAISGPTTEGAGTATFTLRLNTQPTATVNLSLASSDTSEGTVSPATLSFSTSNFATPRTITVRGVNDALDDGDIEYNVVFPVITSTDTSYSGFSPGVVTVANLDDDTAAINVTPASGNTTEAGGTTTFTVVLGTQPAADVVVPVASADATEGSASPASLTFTGSNWNVPQTVTVTGVDDPLDDGDIAYTVAVAPAVSTDTAFNGLDPNDVAITNLDNDSAGITVSTLSGNTTEAGGTATFTVVLNTQPAADVAIGVASTDTTEGSVNSSSLVFTSANWNVPQTVTVTGVNDAIDDGDIAYGIDLAPAVSTDLSFNGFLLADFSLINVDDDVASIVVSAPSAGATSEAGGAVTFTVVLGTQPAADVAIAVSSSDSTEASVAPSSLVFTSANWNVPQTVTVSGVNDDLDDGDIAYQVLLAPGLSSDLGFNGLNPDDLNLTNTDDDAVSLTVSTISGNTTEEGGTATFSVVLGTQPAADVTLGLTSSDITEGTVLSALIFTPVNWNIPQIVTVTGVDDAVDDGDIAYGIITAATTSSDSGYNAINPADLSLSNIDDDVASLGISPVSGNTSEAGSSATFTVVLGTEPGADVEVVSVTSDASEGVISSGGTLLFTPANWNIPQIVTITGVDDALDDGDVAYTVGVSINTGDTGFSALSISTDAVALTNLDNDAANVIVTPAVGDTGEDGTTTTFTVVLSTQPTDNVVIGLSSNDATEGVPAVPTLTFTDTNWNIPQTVTVNGVDDALDDGDISYIIVLAPAASRDAAYSGVNPNDVDVRNIDNDNAAVIVSTISGNTSEAGGTATFTVVLGTQPTANVTMGILSSDTTEGTAAPASLTFTNSNWNVPQTVTVTGVNDTDDDGDVSYVIAVAAVVSTDAAYNGQNPNDVDVINLDDDASEVIVTPISRNTTEAGGTATFTVSLPIAPTADVTIPIASSDTTEGVANVTSLIFTSANGTTPQIVTVTGVDDAIVDGTVSYLIALGPAQSADTNFSGTDPNDVAVANTDDDTIGVTLVETDNSTDVTEGSAQDTYTLVLNSAPTAPVDITIFDDDQVNVDTPSIQFTALDWNIPRIISVTAEPDTVPESTHTGTINHHASSADPDYNNAVIPNVVANITNNDDVDVDVTPISGGSGGSGSTPGSGGGSSTPVLSVIQPNGGQTFTAGQTTQITWSAPAQSIAFVNIYLSIDSGATYTSIALNEANDDAYTWTVPNIATTRARIRIQGSDNVNIVGNDVSDALFTILANASTPGGSTDPGDEEPGEPTEPGESPDDDGFIDPAAPTGQPITEDSPGYTPVFAGDFVRGRVFSTVYYMEADGEGGLIARPFIDRQTFFTYANSFDVIKTIADPQFTLYAIGSPMLPKPGVSLVKIMSSEHVYLPVLRSDGRVELRQISSESLAITMFGVNWSDYVIDLPPTIWSRFVLGQPLTDPVPVDRSQMKTRDELNQ